MKKLGVIDISFKELQDGIYYYDVSVTIGPETRTVVLPRYDVFLGWIEIFGLPPQNEWVILSDLSDFTKSATLTVDGVTILETIHYKKDIQGKTHRLDTIRSCGDTTETCAWTQDYTNAPHRILNHTTFNHPGGSYDATWETAVLNDTSTLTEAELDFYQKITAERSAPDVIIKKTFTAKGVPPPLYYNLFPIHEIVDLTEISGSLVELGYLKKNSPHTVDQVHGDWFKRFDNGEQVLYITESNYSSCPIMVNGKILHIKDTYHKELFAE